MSDRALATIETIGAISPIPDADRIVSAGVRGWNVVVKIDEFTPGDRCLYIEVDALLDTSDPRFAFLAPRGVRTDVEGRSGHVLKTARLRGVYSQGLALPIAEFPEFADVDPGTDVTDRLGIVKWDPPVPVSLAGKVRGMRPSWIPATDEERVQNLTDLVGEIDPAEWIATEKIDGMSTTFYVDPGTDYLTGVTSRNLDLLPEDGNTFGEVGRRIGIHEFLLATYPGKRAAVSGETYGEGVQKNPLRVRGQHFAAFTLRVEDTEIPRSEWPAFLLDRSVPVRDEFTAPTTVAEALDQVEGLRSAIAPDRAAEGLVWRHRCRNDLVLSSGRFARASFKAISNKYLLKNDR